ncbi:MAG TPA: peptidoglycan editing factor PgeF [bacterium]|nr:peptidoglycan editing factor PgeF [bacterium]
MTKLFKSGILDEFHHLMHGFTTRELNNDYDRIAQEFGILPSQIYALKQIHSNQIVVLERGMDLVDIPPGDAYVTSRKDVVIGIKTADCVPILVYEVKQDVVAAIHAGYKGMLAGVIEKAIHHMTDHLSCQVEDMRVAIGPCISVDHYEVSPEIFQDFINVYANNVCCQTYATARPHLDLRSTAKNILEGLGIHPEHIDVSKRCTYEEQDLFFSHRREPENKGRQFNFIGMVS